MRDSLQFVVIVAGLLAVIAAPLWIPQMVQAPQIVQAEQPPAERLRFTLLRRDYVGGEAEQSFVHLVKDWHTGKCYATYSLGGSVHGTMVPLGEVPCS